MACRITQRLHYSEVNWKILEMFSVSRNAPLMLVHLFASLATLHHMAHLIIYGNCNCKSKIYIAPIRQRLIRGAAELMAQNRDRQRCFHAYCLIIASKEFFAKVVSMLQVVVGDSCFKDLVQSGLVNVEAAELVL